MSHTLSAALSVALVGRQPTISRMTPTSNDDAMAREISILNAIRNSVTRADYIVARRATLRVASWELDAPR